MIFSCFTLKLKEKVDGLLCVCVCVWGGGGAEEAGAKGMLAPPSQIIGGPGPPGPPLPTPMQSHRVHNAFDSLQSHRVHKVFDSLQSHRVHNAFDSLHSLSCAQSI